MFNYLNREFVRILLEVFRIFWGEHSRRTKYYPIRKYVDIDLDF
jgi:hypothetical protein